MTSQSAFDPEQYWETRLRKRYSLEGVGNRSFRLEYNAWLYRARLRVLAHMLDDWAVDCRNRTLLDIGVGTGYYIPFFIKRGVGHITGCDITTVAIERLRKEYPAHTFIKSDIADTAFNLKNQFDIIIAFDVFFHIVDDRKFEQATENVLRLCHEKSVILIMDNFLKSGGFKSNHVNHRTFRDYQNIFARHHITVKDVRPIFYLMNDPIDLKRIKNRYIQALVRSFWSLNLKATALLWELGRTGKMLTNIWAASLYSLDRAILRMTDQGPSTKLLMAAPATSNGGASIRPNR